MLRSRIAQERRTQAGPGECMGLSKEGGMKKHIASIAALMVLFGLAMGQGEWTNTPSGSFKIERVWEETLGQNTFANAIVTYKNTTSKTFTKAVTIKGTFLDKADGVIDICERSFFCFEIGPIKPGFEDSVKLEIDCRKGQLKSISVKIARAN